MPPEFMVTTFAFERFLEENGIREAYLRLTSDGGFKFEVQQVDDDAERSRRFPG